MKELNVPVTTIVAGPVPGAVGRIVQMHGEYYGATWGFGAFFESKVARELGEFLDRFDPARDGLWLALVEDRIEGAVAIHGQGRVAHLRWFIAADRFRGQGMGSRLLDTAIAFCRERRYPLVDLWTFAGLHAARHLYEKHGFHLVEERVGGQWGAEVREQRFEMAP
jgi:GNAT superfamily N-acetyltransferase